MGADGLTALNRRVVDRRLALQYIELMTEDENFGVQRSLGSQQPSRKTPHQSKEIAHRTECQPIRRRPSATLGLR